MVLKYELTKLMHPFAPSPKASGTYNSTQGFTSGFASAIVRIHPAVKPSDFVVIQILVYFCHRIVYTEVQNFVWNVVQIVYRFFELL